MTQANTEAVTLISSLVGIRARGLPSAVSPPVEWMPILSERRWARSDSVPEMTAAMTSPGTSRLLRPIVDDNKILSVIPTQLETVVN